MRGAKPQIIVNNENPIAIQGAPDWMSDDARAEFDRILPILIQRKIIGTADMGMIENYCVALGRSRQIERAIQSAGDGIDMKMLRLQDKIMSTCRQLAVEIGLTPSARSRATFRAKDDSRDDDLFSSLDL